ncbi:MAG TPA: amino acid permease, partial [Acidimicrobiales bacterium]|nr:amino acid permease [Acidimicrobiales bacterium]
PSPGPDAPPPSGGEPPGSAPRWLQPARTSPGTAPELPETVAYRVKRRLLGPPLTSAQLHEERLGKPIALAVLSSDVMSSAAYASESILRILVPAAGLGAFGLVTPITALLLVVLGVVCVCYRGVVEAYPVSGGSYVVSRDNFGFSTAQIPGAALLCSYTLTVAVSVAAGVDAVLSAFPGLSLSPTLLSLLFVVLLTYGNLRGIREAGKVFAVPTYWFIASMAVLIAVGAVRFAVHNGLPHVPAAAHQMAARHAGGGLLLGASVFIVLRGFANGGSAMTGMEAISNAVTVFREPQVRNARQTLVLMAAIIGALFLATSALAALTHALPFVSGTPTVLSEMGDVIFGHSGLGRIGYYSLQFSTALILVLGANTSFNGFPLLVSFIAQDSYLPRPLTTRGHRLVYSNGVIALAVLSAVLLVVTRANVASLIPLYATTVFTGFTMAGAGMTRYHLTHPSPGRRRGVVVNAIAFAVSGLVTVIFVLTEFSRGAWAIVIVIPLLVLMLSRTHRRYERERRVLAEEVAPMVATAPVLRHQQTVVLVDRVDLATARALQLARSIAAGSRVQAVHFSIDDERTTRLAKGWRAMGLDAVSLEVVECPDRRLVRAVTELAADMASDGETEVLLILPRRATRGPAARFLHDRSADRIVSAVTSIPHVSATIAPFDVDRLMDAIEHPAAAARAPEHVAGAAGPRVDSPVQPPQRAAWVAAISGTTPLGEVAYRQRTRVAGRVRSVETRMWPGSPVFECTLVDGTGALVVVFVGRRSIAGIEPGARLVVEGAVGTYQGRLAMLSPSYEFAAEAPSSAGSPGTPPGRAAG